MAFINNRLDFFNGESYGEIQHANAFAKGLPNFVVQGLELTGTTLNNGIFVNNGTFGQLGTSSETHTIISNYTGFIVIKSTLNGRNSTSEIVESTNYLASDPRTAGSERYFTIYELSNGSIVKDYRHVEYVKSFVIEQTGDDTFRFILNGFPSNEFVIPDVVTSVAGVTPDENGNVPVTSSDVGALPITGGEITGSLTIPHATVIKGTGEGDANTSLLNFTEADGITRRGYIGDSNNGSVFAVGSDIGHLNLVAPAGKNVQANGNTVWDTGNLDPSIISGATRTLIDDIDIGYDDTIHATTPLQDILKDLFDKSQAVVGTDKPFELTFSISQQSYSPNLAIKIAELIEQKYGSTITTGTMKFKMEVSTVSGGSAAGHSNSNKCSVSWDGYSGSGSYYEWYFDYDNWANVIVRDAKGYLSGNPEMLYTSSGNMGTDITLSDSIYNFEKITCSITDEVGGSGDGMVYINVLGSGRLTFQEVIQGAEGYYLYLTVFNSDVSGKNLTSNNNIYSRKYTHISGQLLIEDLYLQSVSGLNRIYPIGTTHSLETIDGKLYRKITLPNGEVTLKETKIQQDFYVSDDK